LHEPRGIFRNLDVFGEHFLHDSLHAVDWYHLPIYAQVCERNCENKHAFARVRMLLLPKAACINKTQCGSTRSASSLSQKFWRGDGRSTLSAEECREGLPRQYLVEIIELARHDVLHHLIVQTFFFLGVRVQMQLAGLCCTATRL